MQLRDDRGHHVKHFGITSVWNIAAIVPQDGVEERGYNVCVDHL